MLDPAIRQTIISLHNSGKSRHEISKILNISRNTVKKILLQGVTPPQRLATNSEAEILVVVKELFQRCQGNAVRIQEILQEDYNTTIAYSSLTRLIQAANLRASSKRFGEYVFAPGEEMQHDTSPHNVLLGDTKVKAQCASLVFGYSRMIFMQYYSRFTRFEAKAFLKVALETMGGSCQRCVVDNTSVILASGSGANAVFSPEMHTLARMFGFEFMAHRVGDPNRKAKVERPFFYIETNFLAGRFFKDWDDLNAQALVWCNKVNGKEKRSLGMSPICAYAQEKPYLVALPDVLPPIYEHHQRIVDTHGFVNLDSNRYSAPDNLVGKTLDIYKHLDVVRLFYQHKEIASHRRLLGKHLAAIIAGHRITNHELKVQQQTNEVETALFGHNEILDLYINDIKQRARGRGLKATSRLLELKRTYNPEAFLKAVKQAQHYGLYDLNRLEELIIKLVAGNYFNLDME